MKLKGLFAAATSATEQEWRKTQTTFGHRCEDVTLEEFLYGTYRTGCFSERRFRHIADSFLQGAPKRVLEIGAGSGDFSVYCSTLYPQHIYILSEPSIEYLKKNMGTVAPFFKTAQKFEFVQCTAESIPLARNGIDIVFIKSAVHHFDNPKKAFAEIRRVLKKGGWVVFFNEPVCLSFPIISRLQKLFFGTEERAEGINENIYTIGEYCSFAPQFKKNYYVEPVYREETERNSTRWRGVKKLIWRLISANDFLLKQFYIYQYNIPFTFVFTK